MIPLFYIGFLLVQLLDFFCPVVLVLLLWNLFEFLLIQVLLFLICCLNLEQYIANILFLLDVLLNALELVGGDMSRQKIKERLVMNMEKSFSF